MGCFSFAWLAQFLVWLVMVGAVLAILRLLIPYVLSLFGWIMPGIMIQIINIVIVATIMIAVIYFAFAAIGCLSGGSLLPPMPHR